MGRRPEGSSLHYRCSSLCDLDGFAATILLSARRPVEIGADLGFMVSPTERLRAARASDLAAKVIDTSTPGGTDVEE